MVASVADPALEELAADRSDVEDVYRAAAAEKRARRAGRGLPDPRAGGRPRRRCPARHAPAGSRRCLPRPEGRRQALSPLPRTRTRTRTAPHPMEVPPHAHREHTPKYDVESTLDGTFCPSCQAPRQRGVPFDSAPRHRFASHHRAELSRARTSAARGPEAREDLKGVPVLRALERSSVTLPLQGEHVEAREQGLHLGAGHERAVGAGPVVAVRRSSNSAPGLSPAQSGRLGRGQSGTGRIRSVAGSAVIEARSSVSCCTGSSAASSAIAGATLGSTS